VFRIRDPVLFDPWIRDGKNSGSGINILDHISESLATFLGVKIPKFFVAEGIRDPMPF
jgi:hypothetical protein